MTDISIKHNVCNFQHKLGTPITIESKIKVCEISINADGNVNAISCKEIGNNTIQLIKRNNDITIEKPEIKINVTGIPKCRCNTQAGITDAPQDGKIYGRKNSQWVHITQSPPTTNTLPSASTYTLQTNRPIGGNRAIATSDGYAVYASNDDTSLVTVGISKAAVDAYEDVELQTTGKMLISGAGFTKGLPVFVGINGTLTQDISNATFAQRIGIAHSPEILLIDISQPIFIGE